MSKPHVFLYLLIILISGCSAADRITRSEKPVIQKDYIFTITEVKQANKFAVTLSSLSASKICVVNATWPSDNGALDSASNSVFIVVADKKYPFKEINMGFCGTKDCASEIRNGQEIKASLFFKDFDFPTELYSQPKKLVFDPKPYWCDQGKWMN